MIISVFFALIFYQSSEVKAPPELEAWRSWVLYDAEDQLCPCYYNDGETKICAWSSRLDLNVSSGAGAFRQDWMIYAPTWVPLPGDNDYWPQGVTSNGKLQPVLARNGRPFVRLEKGNYTLNGLWQWRRAPASLAIPPATALITLELNGRPVREPKRDLDGMLWLQTEQTKSDQNSDALQVRVFRLLEDGSPPMLHTRIELEVSGGGREVVLPKPLPDGFTPHALRSNLPVRLEQDGGLRIQIRSGSWHLELVGRSQGTLSTINLETSTEPWPEFELWAFSAAPEIRGVTLTGLQAIDPKQTNMPAAWHEFPGYRFLPGELLTIEEKSRGLSLNRPDELTMHRTLWLDFTGDGWTFRDRFDGAFKRTWRLEMNPPFRPGRVSQKGVDRLITTHGEPALPGIEIRKAGAAFLSAEGRVAGQTRVLPAIGWRVDVDKLETSVNLPPGWRLMSALGPDSVSGDWVHSWRLWDFFWVLLIAMSVGRLWGRGKGLLAMAMLILLHGEHGSYYWPWISLLAATALLRVSSDGIAKTIIGLWRRFSLIALILIAIPFITQQFQDVLYPQLRFETGYYGAGSDDWGLFFAKKNALPHSETETRTRVVGPAQANELVQEQALRENFYQEDTENLVTSRVQTGPGLPSWSGNDMAYGAVGSGATLSWRGPVTEAESIRLWLLPPPVNAALAILRVLLLLFTLMIVAEHHIRWKWMGGPAFTTVILASAFISLPVKAQELTPELLKEFRERILKPADCFPHCAEIAEADLSVADERLRVDLQIHAGASVAVPLPGRPYSVRLDKGGVPPLFLDANGVLWLHAEAGTQTAKLVYDLSQEQIFQLAFPLKPRVVTLNPGDWRANGLHENRMVGPQIELRRPIASERETSNSPQSTSDGLSAFARVERTIELHNDWRVRTRVINRNSIPFIAEIPILPGETIITPGIRLQQDRVMVNLPAEEGAALEWKSGLEPATQLKLSALETNSWTEQWHLSASPRWHVVWSGAPLIRYFNDQDIWSPAWSPRGGESLTLDIERPEPLEGHTLTFDKAELKVEPGNRVTHYSLALTIRSSIGGEHAITLPPGATLTQTEVWNVPWTMRVEDDQLFLPLIPGQQRILIKWTTDQGTGFHFKPQTISLEHPNVNRYVTLDLPENRWLLWANGPVWGPAVQFWSILVVLILVGIALGRMGGMPLKTRHWILLGIGLCQVHLYAAGFFVGWFFLFRYWGGLDKANWTRAAILLAKMVLVFATLIAMLILIAALQRGLLGEPNMFIDGNGSYGSTLNWYDERGDGPLPEVSLISLPVWVFRGLMLAWSLWLVSSLLTWLKWAWQCFQTKGGNKSVGKKEPKPRRADSIKVVDPAKPETETALDEPKENPSE